MNEYMIRFLKKYIFFYQFFFGFLEKYSILKFEILIIKIDANSIQKTFDVYSFLDQKGIYKDLNFKKLLKKKSSRGNKSPDTKEDTNSRPCLCGIIYAGLLKLFL